MIEYILGTITKFALDTIEAWGSVGVFVLMTLESANIPIPSEVIMPFSGFLVAMGRFSYWPIIFVGALGNLVGSIISYYAAIPLMNHLKKNREFVAVEKWYERFGEWSIFVGRLLPVVRTFISFPAGMFRVNIWKFSLYTFVGSFLWTWLLTHIGFLLGENWDVLGPYFRQFDYVIVGAGIVITALYAWYHVRGRKEKSNG